MVSSKYRHTDKIAESIATPSISTTGDSYNSALAKTMNGLYKSEVTHYVKEDWASIDLELTILEWVDWFSKKRLHSIIGYMPPFVFEKRYDNSLILSGIAA